MKNGLLLIGNVIEDGLWLPEGIDSLIEIAFVQIFFIGFFYYILQILDPSLCTGSVVQNFGSKNMEGYRFDNHFRTYCMKNMKYV